MNPTPRQHRKTTCLQLLFLGLLSLGCGSDATGSLSVLLTPEDGIIDGLNKVDDGWSVSFSKYIVAVGDIDIHLSTDPKKQAEASSVYVVDLTKVPEAGLALWSFKGLRAGRWEFHYATPVATNKSMRHESVTQSDYDTMVANQWTYLIEGTLKKSDGKSCPPKALVDNTANKTKNGKNKNNDDCYNAATVNFKFGAAAGMRFGPCEIDEKSGFAILENRTQTAAVSIHGDHIFFNGFPTGHEDDVKRFAQWLADSDLNLNATVTRDELVGIKISQLFEIDSRYSLGGSPISLTTMYDYVRSQLMTQGHFQGEGECARDGVDHHH